MLKCVGYLEEAKRARDVPLNEDVVSIGGLFVLIKDRNNFCSGALFIVVGVGAIALSLEYKLGTPARMGSGFFPLCLGIILTGLGIILAVQSCAAGSIETSLERWEWKPLLTILASVAVFAALLTQFGLLIAIAALVIVASFAAKGFRWTTVAGTAAGLAVLCYVIFVTTLELQIPVLPVFM